MQVDAKEAQGGAKWFYRAGLVAIVFSIVLYSMDQRLSNSTRDIDLGKTIHELRLAQTSLGSPATVDPRLANAESAPQADAGK